MAEHFPLPRWFAADKLPGQYSRRHRTDDAQHEARQRYQTKARPASRLRRAAKRTARRSTDA